MSHLAPIQASAFIYEVQRNAFNGLSKCITAKTQLQRIKTNIMLTVGINFEP